MHAIHCKYIPPTLYIFAAIFRLKWLVPVQEMLCILRKHVDEFQHNVDPISPARGVRSAKRQITHSPFLRTCLCSSSFHICDVTRPSAIIVYSQLFPHDDYDKLIPSKVSNCAEFYDWFIDLVRSVRNRYVSEKITGKLIKVRRMQKLGRVTIEVPLESHPYGRPPAETSLCRGSSRMSRRHHEGLIGLCIDHLVRAPIW